MVHLNEGRDPSPPPSHQGTAPRGSRSALVSEFSFVFHFHFRGIHSSLLLFRIRVLFLTYFF